MCLQIFKKNETVIWEGKKGCHQWTKNLEEFQEGRNRQVCISRKTRAEENAVQVTKGPLNTVPPKGALKKLQAESTKTKGQEKLKGKL